jgi:hypothetical protein
MVGRRPHTVGPIFRRQICQGIYVVQDLVVIVKAFDAGLAVGFRPNHCRILKSLSFSGTSAH